MIDDDELSRQLTEAVRGLPGVAIVYPAKPVLEVAGDALAQRLPEHLVDVRESAGFVTIRAEIATRVEQASTGTVALVGERIRDLAEGAGLMPGTFAVEVSVRSVEE